VLIDKWGGQLAGAATGAAVGSVVPGIGTVVGAAVGALAAHKLTRAQRQVTLLMMPE
jgi:phage tail tape-measure protein